MDLYELAVAAVGLLGAVVVLQIAILIRQSKNKGARAR